MKTRRQFFKIGAVVGAVGAGITVPTAAWRAFASVQTSQTPLLAANIPQFVDPLPTFVGNRVTSTTPTVTALEFQQKILPGSVYANLKAPFNQDRKSTRLNSSHANISYAAFCLKKNNLY